MSNITERTSYLRGLADGLGLDKEKKENRLLLEILNVMDEMAQKLGSVDDDLSELSDYVEELDSDLGEVEETLYGGEDEECGCCDCDDCDCDDCGDCDCCEGEEEEEAEEELSFTCPNCGRSVLLKASDIDYDQSPVCRHCGKPFFPSVRNDQE